MLMNDRECLGKKQATMMERLAQKEIEQAQWKNSLTTVTKYKRKNTSFKMTSFPSLHQKLKRYTREKMARFLLPTTPALSSHWLEWLSVWWSTDTVPVLIFSFLLHRTPASEVRTKSMELKQITSVNKRENHYLAFFSWDVQMLWQTALVRKHLKCNYINRITFLSMWKWRWYIIYKRMKTQHC